MATNRFSIPLDELVAKVKGDVDTVVRKATLELFSKVVQRSPVGNPELWAANAEISAQRQSYTAAAEAFNAANPGKRRKGTSRKAVEKKFPLVQGQGYVGGRFKANWNFSYGAPDGSTTESTQQARGAAEAAKAATMQLGTVAYLSNGLPYAKRLEFDAWSKQAVAGMVRISAVEFSDYVREAARK